MSFWHFPHFRSQPSRKYSGIRTRNTLRSLLAQFRVMGNARSEPVRIIFLDVDGVLNNRSAFEASNDDGQHGGELTVSVGWARVQAPPESQHMCRAIPPPCDTVNSYHTYDHVQSAIGKAAWPSTFLMHPS